MCQGTEHIFQIEEWSKRSWRGGGDRDDDDDDKEALVFQETPLCQSIPGWQGRKENRTPKHIAAQQAVTCACTTIYTVIRS